MKIKDRAKPKLPPIEPGVYIGICIAVVDLGEQYSEKYKNYSNKVKFIWEIPSETIEVDGKQEPRQLSKEFTISSGKKGNLRPFISSWNGRTYSDDEFLELDLFDQTGLACQLNVVLNDTGEYANIETVMPLPKGFPAPETKTEFIKWDMDAWDDKVFEKLPEWIREQIKKSTQYQKEHAPTDSIEVKNVAESECPI